MHENDIKPKKACYTTHVLGKSVFTFAFSYVLRRSLCVDLAIAAGLAWNIL